MLDSAQDMICCADVSLVEKTWLVEYITVLPPGIGDEGGDVTSSSGWLVHLSDPDQDIDNLISGALARIHDGVSIIHALIDEVSERRRKPIVLIPQAMDGLEQFGCWLTDSEEHYDFVFYESRTARIHQDHIILHELGHMILGHRTYPVDKHSAAHDIAALMRTMTRNVVIEREAEQLATLLQEAILDRIGLEAMLRQAGDTGWSELIQELKLDC